ncbi:NAD-binding protein [archaeon]|nr:NAD-binding protein [archaeon]
MIIIVGAGEIGVYVATSLKSAGFNVLLVEVDDKIANEVTARYDLKVVNDDATNPEVLKRVGADKAEVVMSLTPSDETNLMVCEFSKELGAKKVAAKVNKSRNQKMFQELGIDVAVSPPLILSYYFEAVAFNYSLIGTKEFDSLFVKIPESSKAVGKKASDFSTKNSFISAICRNGKVIDPKEDETLKAGDAIVLMGNRDEARDISLKLKGG